MKPSMNTSRKRVKKFGLSMDEPLSPTTKRLAATLIKNGAARGKSDDFAALQRLMRTLSQLGFDGSSTARLRARDVLRDDSAVAVLFDSIGPTLRSRGLKMRARTSTPLIRALRHAPKRSVTFELKMSSAASQGREPSPVPSVAAPLASADRPASTHEDAASAAASRASAIVQTRVLGDIHASNRDELSAAVESIGLRVRGYANAERSVLASRPLRQPPESPALLQLTRYASDASIFELALRWTGDEPEIGVQLGTKLQDVLTRSDNASEID